MKKLQTISLHGKSIEVREVEQIGGSEYTDILYRGRDGRYYLEEERTDPLPENAVYTLPRDRAWLERMKNKRVSVREITEQQAMLWFVESFLNDATLLKRFRKTIATYAMVRKQTTARNSFVPELANLAA